MSDEHVWAFLSEFHQGIAELKIYLRERSRLRPGIALRISGAVVSANARELCDLRLDEDPIEREVSKAVFDHDRWAALAGAIYVQTMATKIDHLSDWWRGIGGNCHNR
jgi:hypothetical protein